MTVYTSRLYFDGGEPSREEDEVPGHVIAVWEVGSGQEWRRHPEDPDVWVPVGVEDPIELMWFEVIRDFDSMTDDPSEITHERGCPICGPDGEGCAGHTRTAETALAPLSGGAA